MRSKKKFSLPKPLIDFSNVDTSFADKMKPFDDEKNGRLNLVLVENTNIKTKSKSKMLSKSPTKKSATKKSATKKSATKKSATKSKTK
jgi:hypothetical protein